ncbi:MAG: hypothetical protein ACRD3J_01945, partial [Thermoanaerobaculia bacterium]
MSRARLAEVLMPVRLIVIALSMFIGSQVVAQNPAPPTANDFVAPTSDKPFAEPLASRVAAISESAIGAHIELLASPAMEGRGLGTRGLDTAAEYAATTLRLAGIPPYGAPDSYYQLVP